MSDLIERKAVLLALTEKGQRSRRYKLGESWELNFEEIREAVNAIPEPPKKKSGRLIDANKLLRKMKRIATDEWKMKCVAPIESVWNAAIEMVEKAPTVASGKQEIDVMEVTEKIRAKYEEGMKLKYINKPLAWAIHEVWKEYDKK